MPRNLIVSTNLVLDPTIRYKVGIPTLCTLCGPLVRCPLHHWNNQHHHKRSCNVPAPTILAKQSTISSELKTSASWVGSSLPSRELKLFPRIWDIIIVKLSNGILHLLCTRVWYSRIWDRLQRWRIIRNGFPIRFIIPFLEDWEVALAGIWAHSAFGFETGTDPWCRASRGV